MKKLTAIQTLVASSGIILFSACGGGGGSSSNTSTETSITHNGITYGFVTSAFTGKVWLDKNSGAARVCESQTDTACYGDYYQWGRNTDGHESSISATTPIVAEETNNAGNQFIIGSNDWTSGDDDLSIRLGNWSNTNGASVCPAGFRVPSEVELTAETLNQNVSNTATGFVNFLKLPSAGSRNSTTGNLAGQDNSTFIWTGSANVIALTSNNTSILTLPLSFGFSVRCIKN